MDSIPIVQSKLIIPEIPEKALYSARIKNLGIPDHKATVITAPAGYGKTTSVILSLKKERKNIRWYRMEKDDAYLSLFYAHLLETLFPDTTRSSLDSIKALTNLNSVADEFILQNAYICQDARSVYSNLTHPIYLVFDDFHNVADNSMIIESLRYFILNMPPAIKIIVMSRTETRIINGKLACDHQYLSINEDALRFTQEETEKLLSDKYKLTLTEKQLANIHACSEGWVAGLSMICLINNPSLFQDNIIPPELLTQNPSERFSFYFNEFLEGLNPSMLMDLAKSSVLPDFSCDDLKMCFNIKDVDKIIDWLESGNIYIQKFLSKPVKYRFHSLFRMELEKYLTKNVTDIEIQGIHKTVAEYYETKGEYVLAIHFYISSDNLNRAKQIAVCEGIKIVHSAVSEKIIPIILEFPDYCIHSDPFLLLFKGVSIMNIHSKESFQYFLNSLVLFKESHNVKLMMDSFGMTIPISFVKNNYSYIKGATTLIPKLKVLFANKNSRKKLLLSAFMGAAWLDKLHLGGFLYKYIERMENIEPVWEYCSFMVKGVILYRRGLLEKARNNAQQILNHEAALGSDQWRAVGLSCAHNAPWLMRDIKESKKYLEEFELLAEKYNSSFARGYALRLSAYLKHQTTDFKGITELMEESAQAFLSDGNPTMVCVINTTRYLWEAELTLPDGYPEKAMVELNKLLSLKPGQGFTELCQTITGALYKECGNYSEAEKLLLQAYKSSRRKKAMQSICGVLIHLADLYFRTGSRKEEYRCLKKFGKIISVHRYEYFREMNYTSLVRICSRCIKFNIYPGSMHYIISRYFGVKGADYIMSDPAAAAEMPKNFINSYCRRRQIEKKVKIEFFGSFKLTFGDIIVDESGWRTKKTGGILKYILAFGSEPVSREILASVFWPESDSKAAYTSLRAALYELRKTLAGFGMAFGSENALLIEHKHGFSICDGITAETDTDEFCRLYETYKSENTSSDIFRDDLEETLIRLYQIYKGDFLPGELYDDWARIKREKYKSMAFEVTNKLAKLYLENKRFDDAQIVLSRLVEMDPLDEESYKMLVSVYKSTNQPARAQMLKNQFEKRFESEMGVKPI